MIRLIKKRVARALICVLIAGYVQGSGESNTFGAENSENILDFMVTPSKATRSDAAKSKIITKFEGFNMYGYEPYITYLYDGDKKEEPELPESIGVLLEGETQYIHIPVTWECEEDFWGTDYSTYTFNICLPEIYVLEDQIREDIQNFDAVLPFIEVTFENNMARTYATDIVNKARSYVGKVPYKGGGDDTNGWDCSGFICNVFKQFGFNLWPWRTHLKDATIGQFTSMTDYNQIRNRCVEGDILVFSDHVSIYSGNGKMIHALSTRYGTIETDAIRVWVGQDLEGYLRVND